MKLSKLYLLGYGVLAAISLVVVGVLVYRAYSFDQRVFREAPVPQTEVSANLVIDYGEGNVASFLATKVDQPATILTLLNTLESQGKFDLTLEGKPLGTLVKSINGLVAENGSFWFAYLNGDLISGGIDSQRLNDGDSVELRYRTL